MKICWDNLEGFKLTSNGIFIKNNRDSYVEKESCKRCGASYLDLKNRHSDYCSRSCSLIGRKYSDETKNKMSESKKGKIRHGAYLEGLAAYITYAGRLWADDIESVKIRGVETLKVKCVSCGEYFIPTLSNVIHRIRYLEGKEVCESRFYCSDRCKAVCPVFGQHKYPKGYNSSNEYTSEEYQTWRNEVFRRANNECEFCGKPATDAHHIIPKALAPFFVLDPENGLATCEECHYKQGHKNECNTGIIANKVCL